MGVSVQTRFDTNLNGAISDVDTTAVLDAAPAFTTGYGTFDRGEASEEDIYWGGVSGLQINTLLRGLSQTALTNTEVSGNKKAHLDNATFEGTLLHYIINDKASKSGNEAITGSWSFDTQLPTSTDTPGANAELTTKIYVDTADALKGNLAGGNSWSGTQLIDAAVFDDDGAETASNAAPTSDKKLANKKYVDDSVSSGLASNSVSQHLIYTPAYMTGGNSAEGNYLLWLGTSDGSVRFTINGVVRNVTGINFTTGVTSMNDVASKIQAALRALTGSTETVVWSTNHFVVTSVDTSSSSQVSVASATGGGTDISGAGAFAGMDSDTGNGTATAAVLNPTADAGKLLKLYTDGDVKDEMLSSNVQLKSDLTTKGDIYAATGSGVVTRFAAGADAFGVRYDSSQSTGIKAVPVSRVLGLLNTPVTVTNTTTETTLFTVTVPANSFSTTNAVIGNLYFFNLDSATGTTNDATFKLYIGATNIATLALENGGFVDAYGVINFQITANAATNAQKGTMSMNFSYEGSAGVSNSGAGFDIDSLGASGLNSGTIYNVGTAAVDTTASTTVSVKVTWGNADAGNTVTATHGIIQLIA